MLSGGTINTLRSVRPQARIGPKFTSPARFSMIRINSESRIQLSVTNLAVLVTIYGISFGLLAAFQDSGAPHTSLTWLPWLTVPFAAVLLSTLRRNVVNIAMGIGAASALACMIAKHGHAKDSFLFAFYTTAQAVCIFSPLTALWLPKLANLQQRD